MTEEEIAEWRRVVALTHDVVHPSRPLLGEPAIMEKALATLDSRTARIGALEGLLSEARKEIDRMMYHLADDSGPTHTFTEDDCEITFALEARIDKHLGRAGRGA